MASAFEQLVDYENRVKVAAGIKSQRLIGSNVTGYLVVRCQNHFYAFDIQFVGDVVRFNQASFVPKVADWIIGMVNVKGSPITVIDLNQALLGEMNSQNNSQLIVLSNDYWLSGLLVDQVIGMRHVSSEQYVALDDESFYEARLEIPGISDCRVFNPDKFLIDLSKSI